MERKIYREEERTEGRKEGSIEEMKTRRKMARPAILFCEIKIKKKKKGERGDMRLYVVQLTQDMYKGIGFSQQLALGLFHLGVTRGFHVWGFGGRFQLARKPLMHGDLSFSAWCCSMLMHGVPSLAAPNLETL